MCDEKVPEYGRNMLGGCRHKAYRNVRKRWYKGAKEISKICRLEWVKALYQVIGNTDWVFADMTLDSWEYFRHGTRWPDEYVKGWRRSVVWRRTSITAFWVVWQLDERRVVLQNARASQVEMCPMHRDAGMWLKFLNFADILYSTYYYAYAQRRRLGARRRADENLHYICGLATCRLYLYLNIFVLYL